MLGKYASVSAHQEAPIMSKCASVSLSIYIIICIYLYLGAVGREVIEVELALDGAPLHTAGHRHSLRVDPVTPQDNAAGQHPARLAYVPAGYGVWSFSRPVLGESWPTSHGLNTSIALSPFMMAAF